MQSFRPTKRWRKAYGLLYGENKASGDVGQATLSLPITQVQKTPQSAYMEATAHIPTEEEDQIAVVTWMVKRGIRCNHSPNGGKRHPLEGAKLRRMGVSKGFPDLEIPKPRKGFHGLYIELKRGTPEQPLGKLTPAQRDWLDALAKEGYATYVAYGREHAIGLIKKYLDIT